MSASKNQAAASERPVIGLTTYRQRAQMGVWDTEAAFLPASYINAITNSGGSVVLIPPQEYGDASAAEILSRLDGIVVCGGRDVDPARYNEDPAPLTDKPDLSRDLLEDALYAAALANDVPVLGICRGAQVLNVHLGGTLIQHLPDVTGSTKYQLGNGVFSSTDVDIAPGSKVATLLGNTKTEVQVYHHQAIKDVAPGLTVTAKTTDGVIEAVEVNDHPFAVAVQWHPEQTLWEPALFVGLIEAAKAYRSSK